MDENNPTGTADSEQKAAAAGQAESSVKTPEVSAYAVARMMGVATATDIRILEGKLDLISARVNTIGAKIDRMHTLFQQMPTGSDLERIDVQIGGVKSTLRDLVAVVGGGKTESTVPSGALKGSTQIITADEPESGSDEKTKSE